ncbi:hypothetical protein EJB05_04239, partial [Eragrostis curvula]
MTPVRSSKHDPNNWNVMSPSTKRQLVPAAWNQTTVQPPTPWLPVDLLLEIFARSDAVTIIRCAATSKPIRRAVHDAAFRRRIALRAEAGDAVLITRRVGQAPRQITLPFDAGLLKSFEPVASRRGLVVLRRRDGYFKELHVCNSFTGSWSRLPPGERFTGPLALLAVDDAGASFQLLVLDESMRRMQIFSAEDGKWGAVVETQLPPYFRPDTFYRYYNPVVLGGTTVYWLHDGVYIISLDINTARVTRIELPPECCKRLRSSQNVHKALQLTTSSDVKLCLLVAETCVISMWTMLDMTGEEGGSSSELWALEKMWTRQVVIKRQDIGWEHPNYSVRFLGFGELSSTVLLRMGDIGLVQINLRTKETRVLSHGFKEVGLDKLQMCLQETYLPSLLLAMKVF